MTYLAEDEYHRQRTEDLGRQEEVNTDHEGRIRKLERQVVAIGVVAFGGASVGAGVIDLLRWLFGG